MTTLEWGLHLISRGWWIFPSYGKKPLVKWSSESTLDPDVVARWVTQWPDLTWCIRTGSESDLVVVDWDSYKQGPLAQLALEPYPFTYTVTTLKGGTHFYFRHPGGKVSNSAGKLGDYIDVRGDGGMVVAYQDIAYDTDLAQIPLHWATINAAVSQREAVETVEWGGEGDGTDVGVAALEEAYQTVLSAPAGTRNPTLFQQAADVYKLVAGGELSEETATIAMDTAGRIAGLGTDEVHATLVSARRRGFEEPFSPSKLLSIRNEAKDREALGVGDETYADAEWGSCSDVANALRLADRFEYDLRFAPTHGWLRYQGGRLATVGGYPYDEGSHLSALVKQDVERATTATEMDALEKWAKQSAAMTKIKAALDLAADFPGIRFDARDLDANPIALNTPAGVYDLRDGSRSISSAKDLMTRITNVVPTPGTPVWDRFLKDVLPSVDMRNFIQRAVGYSLTGLTREEVFFILHGNGQNGKSKFLEAIGRALGNYAHTYESKLIVATQHTEHSTTTASLAGVRFAYTNEIDQGAKLDEGKVKSLTGGDNVTARFMRRDEFTFRPTHKLWMATNHLPIIMGTDRGMWRRVLVLPFGVDIPDDKRDNLLSEKLAVEAPGILLWAIEGATQYLRYGLQPPVEVLTATASYKSNEDVVSQFLNDTFLLHPQGVVVFGDLYQEFQRWCAGNGIKAMSAKALAPELDARGIVKTRQGNGKAREGIIFQEGVRV